MIDCRKECLRYHFLEIPFWHTTWGKPIPKDTIHHLIQEKVDAVPEDLEKRHDLQTIFSEFLPVLNAVTERTDRLKRNIRLKSEAVPFHRFPYRTSHQKQQLIDECVREMKMEGNNEEWKSPWSCPVLVIHKNDGGHRFCVDYRQLSISDLYPLPRIEDIVERDPNPRFITKWDLCNGYWQVELDQASREITAFCVPNCKYQFRVLPFGLAWPLRRFSG